MRWKLYYIVFREWRRGVLKRVIAVEFVYYINRPFPSSPRPLYQNEIKCSVFDEEMIFHSHANKTQFHKKGCMCTWSHFGSECFGNSEVAYYILLALRVITVVIARRSK